MKSADIRRGVLAALALGLLLSLAPPHTAKALEDLWYDAGNATTDDGGSWRFHLDTRDDLVGLGFTFMRVTSAACATPPDEAIVFEAQLLLTEAGDQSWEGRLTPVGGPAQSLPALELETGDVHLVPTPGGTVIDTGLDGVPPGTRYTVCLRQP